MDFETFITSLLKFIQSSGNAYFVLYAVATCLLTQIAKKLFVNKVKVDVLHKFDLAVVLPFIFGAVFAVLDVFLVHRVTTFGFETAVSLAVNAAAIGALASTVFKLVSSLDGSKLSNLLTDDVFAVFYTQLLYFGSAREQMLSKNLTLKQFAVQVKLIATNAVSIYKEETDEETKRQKLAALLSGIIDENSVSTCVNGLHKAMLNFVKQNAVTDSTCGKTE